MQVNYCIMVANGKAPADSGRGGGMARKSGILLHITSLETSYGIGTMGQCARSFAAFLKRAGQSYWQMLPLGPTGYGDSPYQPFSSFAGNPLLIDLDMLAEEGLLDNSDLVSISLPEDPSMIDYAAVQADRRRLLRRAWERRSALHCREAEFFTEENSLWLADYALFASLKEHFRGDSWQLWPEELRRRRPEALDKYRKTLRRDIEYHSFVQYLFFKQWHGLRSYINGLGLRIIGDLPIYVAEDSADVWADPDLFDLNDELHVSHKAGVPPDYFSPEGQLWGNPLYRWPAHAKNGYEWWLRRVGAARRFADVIRIDHFRGFLDYWTVPADVATARTGHWRSGPGADLIRAIKTTYPDLPVIAEDLGLLSRKAVDFVRESGYPGMKVLQFSFDASRPGVGAPHTFPGSSVCYTGTHDNATAAAWLQHGPEADVALAKRYFGLNEDEGLARGLIRGGMACPSDLLIVPMQDWLGLDDSARMNTPGTVGPNWRWRMYPGQRTVRLASEIAAVTKIFGRSRKRRGNGAI